MPPSRTFLDFIIISIQAASRPFISRSFRRLQERISRAYITTPPPCRSRLSVLKGGKKFWSVISFSLNTAMSHDFDSALIRSSFGNKLCTLR